MYKASTIDEYFDSLPEDTLDMVISFSNWNYIPSSISRFKNCDLCVVPTIN